VPGDMLEPPVRPHSYEVVVSAFGVIFAPDPERALQAIAGALRSGGRALLSAWVPRGPIHDILGVFSEAVAEASGQTPPARFAWHDPAAIAALTGAHGAEVTAHDEQLAIGAPSPEEYLALGESDHPLSAGRREPLERAGTYAATCERALGVLRDANEDPAGFLVHSPYRVIELRGLAAS